MQYEKTVKDTYGDEAIVEAGGSSDRVYLTLPGTEQRDMSYTPEQARALARALKRAANVAEGKPAKTPKPKATIFRDADGDYWHLSPNGFYGIDRPSDSAHRTIDSIIAAYGSWGGERP